MGIKPRRPAGLSWSEHAESSDRWREAGQRYCAAINAFVRKGETEGWDRAGDEPPEERTPEEAAAVVDIVRRAQTAPDGARVRELFPPGFAVLASLANERGQWIGPIVYVDDDLLIVRAGNPWEETATFALQGRRSHPVPDLIVVGRSANRQIIGCGRREHVTLHRGWDGPVTATLPWPNGGEGLPDGLRHETFDRPSQVDELIPFDDGQRALLVSGAGVFLLQPSGATLLYPRDGLLQELIALAGDDAFSVNAQMQHGAVSPDQQLIVVGGQDGKHIVLDGELRVVAEVGPHGEYPHHALFSADGRFVALNACHFYNGATIRVACADVRGLNTDFYAEHPAIEVINDFARVYASASRGGELMLGDAYGYVHGVAADGSRWKHFVGSNITGMDISPGGDTLAVSTVSGMVHLLELDAGDDPYRIGTSNHRERMRWLLWAGEDRPLCW